MMFNEWLPKGYNSWEQYRKDQLRKQKIKDALGCIFTLILILGGYIAVAWIETSL